MYVPLFFLLLLLRDEDASFIVSIDFLRYFNSQKKNCEKNRFFFRVRLSIFSLAIPSIKTPRPINSSHLLSSSVPVFAGSPCEIAGFRVVASADE
jgi:hypothetical protein